MFRRATARNQNDLTEMRDPMRISTKIASTLVAFGVMIALSACSGDPSSNVSGGGGGPVRIAVKNIPTTLDPGQNFHLDQYAIMNLTSGTLTELNPDAKGVHMGLAESVQAAGDLQYVVKLKPNLKFSDGSSLTAKDVAASFSYYLADKSNGYSYTYTRIAKVTAVDDVTVNFDLTKPYPSLPIILALPSSAIIPSAAIEARHSKDIYKGDPLPTAGQFEVASFNSDEITFKANPNYVGSKPSTKSVIVKKVSDPAARLAQLQGGEIDVADNLSPKEASQLNAPAKVHTTFAPIGATFLMMNNRANSVLSDVRIRKALALAVDRKQVNEVAYAGQNRPALGLWGNASTYNEDTFSADAAPANAKQMLAGTKCANGCVLKFVVNSSDQTAADTAVVVQQNLKAIGIQVNLQSVESATASDLESKGNFDLVVTGSLDVADYPDGFLDFTLGPVLDGFYTGYSSPQMSKLIESVDVATGSERTTAAHQLTAQWEKDLPNAPLVDFADVWASRVTADRFTMNDSYFYRIG
jgi:peptide/nickel transport system substrate-binding protein